MWKKRNITIEQLEAPVVSVLMRAHQGNATSWLTGGVAVPHKPIDALEVFEPFL